MRLLRKVKDRKMRHFNILDISIYQIQLFLTVAEEGNFSRAANLMNLAQPTLSRRIAALEDVVGVSLFERDKRPVELTEAGAILYRDWKDIARRFEQSVEKAKDVHQRSQNKLVVCMVDSGRQLKEALIAGKRLEESYPGLSFVWDYSPYNRWREQIHSGEIDVMLPLLMEEDFLEEEFEHERLMLCPKLVCMLNTNPLSKKEHIAYEDLKDQGFIVNSPSIMPAHHSFIRKICLKNGGFEPNVVLFTSNTHALIGNLKNGNEVVVCDRFLRDIDSPFIKSFPLPDTCSGLLAVWKKGSRNPYIRPFVQLLKDCFAEFGHTIP